MRVVIAGDYPENPPTLLGGIQAVVYSTLQGLADYDDLDLHVVTCEKWRTRPLARPEVVRDRQWTVHYLPSSYRIPHTWTMLTTDRWAIRRRIKALAPDVIHAHGQAAAYPFAAFDTGYPAVVSVHGINTLEAKIEQRGGWLRGNVRTALWGCAERRCLREASDLVVTSPFVGQAVAPYARGRLHVVENPVHDSFFGVASQPVPGKVLIVGTIRPLKGTLEAIRAMRLVQQKVPHAELQVVGPFMLPFRDYGDQVKQLVTESGAGGRIHLTGHIDHAALLEAYRTSQVFLFPSWQEASPLALAQAMAAGLPSVVSDIGGTQHLIEDGVTGYRVPVGDVESLAEHTIRLLQDEPTRQRFGQNAQRIARERFTQESAARNTRNLYRTLIGF